MIKCICPRLLTYGSETADNKENQKRKQFEDDIREFHLVCQGHQFFLHPERT